MAETTMTLTKTIAPLFTLALLTACTTGEVRDSAGKELGNVEVIAYGDCFGAGCATSQVQTPVPGGYLEGYRSSTNHQGRFFYDPYAEVVSASDAMAIDVPSGSPQSSYKLQYRLEGYQDTWLDFSPAFESHSHQGSNYLITEIPAIYLCLEGAVDSDGDGICDEAEAHYGTDAQRADSDGDGEYDDEELFGSGSPFATGVRSVLHYNINVSNFEASKRFYELLGFKVLLEVDVDVSDPMEAQGLNLPPYRLKAAPMILGDGFIIDLIQFYSPYDPQAPNADVYSLGLATLSLQTDNLEADIAALEARDIPYSVFMENDGQAVVIRLSDPDGTVILLTQVDTGKGLNSTGETSIHGLLSTNINVTDYQRALAFYQQAGFRLVAQKNGIATVALQDGRHITLTASSSRDRAYEQVNHLGIARIALETTNIDQDIRVLEAAGIEFYTSEAIVPSGPLSILRYVCFEDPDGTVIELVEYNQ